MAEFFDENKIQDQDDVMLDRLWQRYKSDQNPEWLKTMLALNVFKNRPMPNEIAQEILYHLNEHINEGLKLIKNKERDQLICRMYGLLCPDHDGTFNKAAMRDIAFNYPELNAEAVRAILRRKFKPKKHIA